jgi:hypothetical protein
MLRAGCCPVWPQIPPNARKCMERNLPLFSRQHQQVPSIAHCLIGFDASTITTRTAVLCLLGPIDLLGNVRKCIHNLNWKVANYGFYTMIKQILNHRQVMIPWIMDIYTRTYKTISGSLWQMMDPRNWSTGTLIEAEAHLPK